MKRRAARPPHAQTTIRDVARELGISVATVSRALTRPELLRRDTRDRVIATAERLGYRPNLLARGLRRGETRALLFIVPTLSPFFLEIYAGAEDVAREADFALLLGSSRGDAEREEACFDQVVSGRADGIILLTGLVPSAYASGKRPLPPLIAVLERVPHHAVPVIRTDHRSGAAAATRHLIDLGHRRIAHIAGSRRAPSSAQRLGGYRSTLESAGLAAPPELVHPGDFGLRSGLVAMEALLTLRDPPTAVLCGNDEMAFGAILALNRAGLAVPRDVSVVGFDNQAMAEYSNPPLTTVHIPREELGRRAALALIEQLKGRSVAHEPVLPTRLIVRESTAPVRARRLRSPER
ncbi:MAG TPA: LacI family DNA-binding transcriptional regulator [Steroidobacteraceae bacterium]|nr:LacI family DNA-binding transcriptional regulator [Steroidobacteraceae bacterium]